MSDKIIWAFIDYENLGSLEKLDLSLYQRILVFCGKNNSKIKLGDKAIPEFLPLDILKINSVGSNNLDFHLAYYLGKFSESADKNIRFHVISKDKGFDALVDYINDSGRECKKITVQVEVVSQKQLNLSQHGSRAIHRLRQLDGRKRPRNDEKLTNWMISQCKIENSEEVFKELVAEGFVKQSDKGLKYEL